MRVRPWLLGDKLDRCRRLPDIEIVEDMTAQHSQRIEELLRGLGVSKAPEADSGDDLDDQEAD